MYTAIKALPVTQQMKLINEKKFAKTAPDKNSKTFVVHIIALEALKIAIYPFQVAQGAFLQANQALSKKNFLSI